MITFFGVLYDIISAYVDASFEEEKRLAEQDRIRRIRKEKERQEKERKYHEMWVKATEESLKNPDEWRILPYGWSPFGIFI